MSFDVERARKRLVVMAGVEAASLLAAIAFAVGHFVYGIGWMLWSFVAVLLAGFAGQIWFIAGLGRADKGV